MTYKFQGRKNVLCIKDLEKTDDIRCGPTIKVQDVPQHLLNKLFHFVKVLRLQKIVLHGAFDKAQDLRQLLLLIGQNRKIKTDLELDIRNNDFDNDCAVELIKLIYLRLFKKLELPPITNPSCCRDILHGFQMCRGKIEVLNLTGSILDESSIECLEILIKESIVTKRLLLTKCMATAKQKLTEGDHYRLHEAEKHTRTLLGMVKKLTIDWFDFDKIPEEDVENLDHNEYQVVALPTPPSYITGKSGKIIQVAHFMVKKRFEKSAWKLVRGRKRQRYQEEATSCKVRIREAQVEELANILGKQTLEHANHQSQTLYACEESEVLDEAGPMDACAGPSSHVQSEGEPCSSQQSLSSRSPASFGQHFAPASGRRSLSTNNPFFYQRNPGNHAINPGSVQLERRESTDRGVQTDEPPAHHRRSSSSFSFYPPGHRDANREQAGVNNDGLDGQNPVYAFQQPVVLHVSNVNVVTANHNQNAIATQQQQGATAVVDNSNRSRGTRSQRREQQRGSVSEPQNDRRSLPGRVGADYQQPPERDTINSTGSNHMNKSGKAKKGKGNSASSRWFRRKK